MPFIVGWLFGQALGRWGVIGLFTWLFGIGLASQMVAANTSPTVGKWSAGIFFVALLTWAMRNPAESEAKRGFLRGLRVLIAMCMVVTGLTAFVLFFFHDFRFSESQPGTWIATAASTLCWLALFGFRKWLDFDERRMSAG